MEKVSVIITTKNEEKNIESCILSIKNQSYPANLIELIVVDNNSSDNTKQISSKYTDLIFDKGPERSAQRNFGMINRSSGSYVMFVDADMILSPNLIELCVGYFNHNNCLALHIPEIVLGKNYFSNVRRFERSFYNGTVIDGARFFKKEVFVAVGGFDESMSGPEDWDIDKKIKKFFSDLRFSGTDIFCAIGLLDNGNNSSYNDWVLFDFIKSRGVDPRRYGAVIYHNESEFDLKSYLKKKGYYSESFGNYINKWGKEDEDIKRQLGGYYRLIGVFIEGGKWKKILFNPFLVLGMVFLRGLVGFVYLFNRK